MSSSTERHFGEMVREHRIRLGMTLEDLAAKVGKTKGFLSLIENNKRQPSVKLIQGLALILHGDATEWTFLALEKDRLAQTIKSYRSQVETFLRSARRNPRS